MDFDTRTISQPFLCPICCLPLRYIHSAFTCRDVNKNFPEFLCIEHFVELGDIKFIRRQALVMSPHFDRQQILARLRHSFGRGLDYGGRLQKQPRRPFNDLAITHSLKAVEFLQRKHRLREHSTVSDLWRLSCIQSSNPPGLAFRTTLEIGERSRLESR